MFISRYSFFYEVIRMTNNSIECLQTKQNILEEHDSSLTRYRHIVVQR